MSASRPYPQFTCDLGDVVGFAIALVTLNLVLWMIAAAIVESTLVSMESV